MQKYTLLPASHITTATLTMQKRGVEGWLEEMCVCVCGVEVIVGWGERAGGSHMSPPSQKKPQRFPDGGGVVMNEPLIAEPSRHW